VSNTARTSHAYDMSKIETVEAVQQEQVVSCKLDIKRIVWIFVLPLMSQRKTNKLSHNCLFQELYESLFLTVFLCCVRMPKLRETYLQIQERNAREIRQRTRERVRALHRDVERVIVEDLPEIPIVIAEQSYLVPFLVCVICILVLVVLLLWQSTYLSKQV
jgi:hypothetical protein